MTTTYSNCQINKPLTFEDIAEAIKLIPPKPADKIRMGKNLFKKFKKIKVKKSRNNDFRFVGSLYGVNIYQDLTLKPNEYRIGT